MNRLTPGRIILLYVVAGSVWILFSDRVLAGLTADPEKAVLFQTFKGLLYILLTSVLLLFLLRRTSRERQEVEAALRAAAEDAVAEKNKTEAIIAAIGDGISIQDRGLRILYENEAQRKIVGDHVGGFCYEAYEKRAEACGGCPVQMAYRDGQVHTVERSAPTEQGLIHVEITASPLRNAHGEIIAGIEVVRDITERKKALEDLRQANERLNVILETSLETIMIVSPEGVVMLWNKAAEQVFGWTSEEVLDRFNPMVPDDRKEEFRSFRERVLRGETLRGIEIERTRKDGSPISVSLSAAPLRDEDGMVAAIIAVVSDITDRKRMERMLEKSARDYRLLFESNPHPMWVYDLETLAFLAVNNAAVAHYGFSKDEFLGMTIKDIRPPEDVSSLIENISRVSEGVDEAGIWRHRKKDGSITYVEIVSHTLEFGGRRAEVVLANDVTDRSKLEEQLRHAQKMEAAGQLAGGVAHDFNNILTVIIGYASLLQRKIPDDDPIRPNVEEILQAAERAAGLTQSLLAFSRKQIIDLRRIDLNETVRKVERLLRRVIGEDVELKTVLAGTALTVLADSGQIEQVLMNFATNARDAMPDGGTFILETEQSDLDPGFLHAHGYGRPGRYALLSVTDTGLGMDEQTRKKIFEPFFTTKETGQGTGLGLAIVYGIVKQHGGYITVYSEPGKGTTFRIYLPIATGAVEEEKEVISGEMRGGTETILVAEDDEGLRKLASTVLGAFGYTVLTAADGEEAVDIFAANREAVSLVILDVVMPKKNGKEAYEEIRKLSPDLPALFTSGYTANIIHKKGILEEGLHFIHKPVSPQELLLKVREVLDRQDLS